MSFNVSHASDLIVLAVATDRAIGVDAENMRSRDPCVDLADGFFAPSEAAALRALPAELRANRFFAYWTLKESYIKARGMGLLVALEDFSFELTDDSGIARSVSSKLQDVAEKWSFWLCELSSEHVLSVCAERVQNLNSRLTAVRTLPLEMEEPYPLQVVRSTSLEGTATYRSTRSSGTR